MNEKRDWDLNYNRGRNGGDMPDSNASSHAWDAYNEGRAMRQLDRAVQEMWDKSFNVPTKTWFNFD